MIAWLRQGPGFALEHASFLATSANDASQLLWQNTVQQRRLPTAYRRSSSSSKHVCQRLKKGATPITCRSTLTVMIYHRWASRPWAHVDLHVDLPSCRAIPWPGNGSMYALALLPLARLWLRFRCFGMNCACRWRCCDWKASSSMVDSLVWAGDTCLANLPMQGSHGLWSSRSISPKLKSCLPILECR